MTLHERIELEITRDATEKENRKAESSEKIGPREVKRAGRAQGREALERRSARLSPAVPPRKDAVTGDGN